ncbi:MAG: hypothetical protein Fur003_4150 [Candidatus Dojkabacteria bacterium]
MQIKSRFYKSLPSGELVETSSILGELIAPGAFDKSGVRQNIEGELFLINYSQLAFIKKVSIDTLYALNNTNELGKNNILMVGLYGNNLTQTFDRYWDSSQIGYWMPRAVDRKTTATTLSSLGFQMLPAQLATYAISQGCSIIHFGGGEPSVYADYLLDLHNLIQAKQLPLKIGLTTNGTIDAEFIKSISTSLHKLVINLNSQSDEFYIKHYKYSLHKLLPGIKNLLTQKIDVEFSSEFIPGENDALVSVRKLAELIFELVGENAIWQLHRFTPTFRILDKPQTSEAILEYAIKVANELGFKQAKLLE